MIKRKIAQLTTALFMVSLGVFAVPMPVLAAGCEPADDAIGSAVFEITPWYKYLPSESSGGRCYPTFPTDSGSIDYAKGITLVIAAIIELLMRVAGLISIIFVFYGTIQYITSQGEPENLKNARSTITNALIGFVVVLLSIAIIQFIGRGLR